MCMYAALLEVSVMAVINVHLCGEQSKESCFGNHLVTDKQHDKVLGKFFESIHASDGKGEQV